MFDDIVGHIKGPAYEGLHAESPTFKFGPRHPYRDMLDYECI